jgi:predicted PurR-regulated permease PerM
VVRQADALAETVPEAWRSFRERLADNPLGARIEEWMSGALSDGGPVAGVAQVVMRFGGGVADALLAIVGGVYLAAQPRLYRRGLLKLMPRERRELVDEALRDTGRALKLWLGGQLVSMIVVGLVVGLGLWAIGVPSALTLGLLAGVLEFVPIVGPVIAAIPAILLALAQGPEVALWTLGLYLVVQQVEGNLLQPLIQQHAVRMPAAVLLFALLVAGILFGLTGVVLAAPLAVATLVMVKRLYVREALDTETPLPGRDSG